MAGLSLASINGKIARYPPGSNRLTPSSHPNWAAALFYGIATPSSRILHFASIGVAKTKGVWYKLVTTDGLEEGR